MMKPLIITAFAIPILALAASQLDAPQRGVPPGRQKQLARMRMMRIAGLADALGLDDGTALHLNDVMRQFDERRVALEVENAELPMSNVPFATCPSNAEKSVATNCSFRFSLAAMALSSSLSNPVKLPCASLSPIDDASSK